MDGRDGLSLSLAVGHAHSASDIVQSHPEFSYFPKYNYPETPRSGGVCSLTVSSFYMSLPHGDPDGGEYREDAAHGLNPSRPIGARRLSVAVRIAHQQSGDYESGYERQGRDDRPISAGWPLIHSYSLLVRRILSSGEAT